MDHTEACIALNMVPNMGPVRLRKLLQRLGTPENVLSASESELRQVDGIGADLARTVATWEKQIDLPAEMKRIAEFGARVITAADAEYPPALLQLHNPPIVLYCWGTVTQQDHRAVGVVGSRKTSHYGTESAKKISYQLAYAGLTVVSGLARGIDTAAHQGALAAKGRTIAVIGSGLMDLYPPENLALAEKIREAGAVVSEFPMTFPPSPQTFPYRNRIVAGWGSGLLVVEAGLKSGALITANQALENGRLVYAVPGQIDRPTSAGSNRLIQQGAKLITSAADILDDLTLLIPPEARPQPGEAVAPSPEKISRLSPEEEKIMAGLDEGEASMDDLVTTTGLPAHRILSTLLALEMKRLVKKLPGQRFIKS